MSLGRNTAYNLVGFLIPTFLAFATVPAYVHLIGAPRYGVLSLVWLVLGYFGIFDLGLGVATTQRIAAQANATPQERARTFWTAIITNIFIGLIGGLVIFGASWIMFAKVIPMPDDLRHEVLWALPYLALALPMATTIGVLSGALAGCSNFRVINVISVYSTIIFQLLPLAIAWKFSTDLRILIPVSIVARSQALIALWHHCRKEFGANQNGWDRNELKALLSQGSWMTLTSLINPLLTFTDRFMIGALLGPGPVTTYAVPFEAVRRISGVATSVGRAIFPSFANSDRDQAFAAATHGMTLIYAMVTPACAVALVWMKPLMILWLGQDLGVEAAPIARVLLLATWLNTYMQIPAQRLQAGGRPDILSKIMLAELVPYLISLYFCLKYFGLIGAAWAFLLRIVLDSALLYILSDISVPRFKVISLTFATALLIERAIYLLDPDLRYLIGFGLLAGGAASIVTFAIISPAVLAKVPFMPRFLIKLRSPAYASKDTFVG